MKEAKVYTALGLMSGTSMDGVDAAVIRTDGRQVVECVAFESASYPPRFRQQIAACLNRRDDPDALLAETAHGLTQIHANLVKSFDVPIDLIGFHGQTIWHDPAQRKTLQVGNAQFLANMTGIPVVYDFRSKDMAHGGQGAPLIPVYHRALVQSLVSDEQGVERPSGRPTAAQEVRSSEGNEDVNRSSELRAPAEGLRPVSDKRVAVVNIGGVGNVTYIGAEGELTAFDTGPGNALIDDWIRGHKAGEFDTGGACGLSGIVDSGKVDEWMTHAYFAQKPPKSLDRNDFKTCRADGMSVADGAATLADFTAQSIIASARHFPDPPESWIICGGGRHNQAIMQGLRRLTNAPVINSDDLGWDGDAIEAQGFAYMAVRSMLGLPLSFPSTTGVSTPMTGGSLIAPDSRKR